MHYSRPLQWVSLATAFLACVWFAPSLLDPFNIPKLAILIVGAAALVGLLAGSAKQWFKVQEWPVWGALLLFLLGLTAAALASDQNSYRTLWGAWARNDGWLAYASLAVILFSVAIAFRGADARFGLYALITAGYVQVGYGLLQTTGNDPVNWNNGYNPILGTVGNPNFASALLGISAVAMCWVAIDEQSNLVARIANGLIALVAVWLTIRSDSIQGTLAFGAGFATFLAVWISDDTRPNWLRRLLWPYLGLGVVGAALGVLGLTGSGPLAGILYSQNLVNRTYYWRAGWNMFKSDPIFGIGIDSFGDYYRIMRLPEQVAATSVQTVSNAAHSVIFQMLGTGGVVFFGMFLLIQVVAAVRGLMAIRQGEHRLLAGAALATWVSFTLQSLFSIDQLGLTVWGWVISGLLIAVSFEGAARPISASRARKRSRARTQSGGLFVPVAISAALMLGSIALVAPPLATESAIRIAVSYAFDPQKPDAAAQSGIKNAVLQAADGVPDPYWRATAVQKLFQIGAVDDGLKFAETSAREFPMDVTLWNIVATAYEQTNRQADAVTWRERTVYLDPLNTDYAKQLAEDRAAK